MNDMGFDTEFMSDEEVEEMMSSIIVTVGETVDIEERRTSILNPIKLKQLMFTYNALKYITRGSKATVTYKLHEPFTSVGYVSVVGSSITFSHPEWFIKISEYASNFEIYPKTDGTIQINFTFHGLTLPIE